jgi:hypothetical protein
MTAEDVKALPIDRKIQIMEAIWEDFRDRFDRLDVSQQQKDLSLEGECAVVWAVIDLRKDPAWIREKLRE